MIFALLFAVVNSEACFFAVNGSSGFISSSGTKNYKRCTWIITAPSNHTVKLIFTTCLSDYTWGKDEIQVYDGKTTNDTVLGVSARTRQPFVIQTSGRFMMVSLKKKILYWATCILEGRYYTTKGKL